MGGSATSTSLMSRGRSMTTDLPTPRGTKRALASLPTSSITGRFPSAAGDWCRAARKDAMVAMTSSVVRISVGFDIVVSLIVDSFRRRYAGDTEAHHVHASPAARAIIVVYTLAREVSDAAQRERHC